jgi:hypothetical protein
MIGGFLGVWILSSCGVYEQAKQQVEDVKDKIEGLTNPLLMQGILLGVEEPSDSQVSELLAAAEFDLGTTANIFLADAANASDAENAPVTGATVTIRGVEAVDEGTGLYAVLPTPEEDSLPYVDGALWTLDVWIGEAESTADFELPGVAVVEVPPIVEIGESLDLDFTGQGFDSALVVVIDAIGQVTFTNEPASIGDVLDITQQGTELEILNIPAEAFEATEGLYVVGVAGMLHTDEQAIEGMNTLLSSLMSGKMRFYGTSTLSGTLPYELP